MSLLSDLCPKPYIGLAPITAGLQYSRPLATFVFQASNGSSAGQFFPLVVLQNFFKGIGSGGAIQWQTPNSSSLQVISGQIQATLDSITAGAEYGAMQFAVPVNGVVKSVFLRAITVPPSLAPGVTGDFVLGSASARWGAVYMGTGTINADSSADIPNSLWAIGTFSTHTLALKTNNTSRFYIDAVGRASLGLPTLGHVSWWVAGTHPGSASTLIGILSGQGIPNTASSYYGFQSNPATIAAAFSTSIFHYYVGDATKGAGSTVATQVGVYIPELSSGSSNIGIYSTQVVGTNRWVIYAGGGAQSYHNGAFGIGDSTNPLPAQLSVSNIIASNTAVLIAGAGAGDTLKLSVATSGSNNAIRVIDATPLTRFVVKNDGTTTIGAGTVLNGALLSVNGRIAASQNSTFDLEASVRAATLWIDGSVTVAAGHEADAIAVHTTPTLSGSGGNYLGLSAVINAAGAPASGSLLIALGGQVNTAGVLGSIAYGVYSSAMALVGHAGTLVGCYMGMKSAATSLISIGGWVQHDGTLDRGYYVEALTSGDHLGYGVYVGTDSLVTGAAYFYKRHVGSTGAAFEFQNEGGSDLMAIDSNGDYYRAGTKVLSTRRTGWVAWTGTATRTTIATGSATTANCAEAIKALTDDLIAHGIIGT